VAPLETTVTPNSKDVREGGQEASPKRESGPGALDKGRLKRARVPASPSCFGFRLCRACQPAPRSWGLRRIISIHHIWSVVGACARAMLSTVLAMLMINALGAMGSPCVRPSKDIRARIESALDEIDEINQCHGEHVLMLCTVAVFNSKLLFLFELCLRKWISEIRALQELVVLEARRISMRGQKEQWYKVSAELITAESP